jgi:hypothetical protein
MKKPYILALATIFSLQLMAADGNSVPTPLQRLTAFGKNMQTFSSLLPQEKVYLHFDNTGYFQNETIWFKAYVLRSDKESLSDMSRVLYVELVSPSGDVLQTEKFCIKDGQADGAIKLDNVLESGFYEVRAYTRYMMNWDNDGIFSRVFPIYNAPSNKGKGDNARPDFSKMVINEHSFLKRLPNNREAEDADNVADSTKKIKTERNRKNADFIVHFYPEGGHVVKGLEGNIAFEVANRDGKPIDCKGYIMTDRGDTLEQVKTVLDGRGVFSFLADGEGHHLLLMDEKGKWHTYPLPETEEKGCGLNLNILDKRNVYAQIAASADLWGIPLGLTLQHNGNLIAFDTLTLKNNEPVLKTFKRRSLPAGVNELTLFDANGRIWADRLFFIYPDTLQDVNRIVVSTPNEYLAPCGKVMLNARALPQQTFSLSVRDAATQTNGNKTNSATWLLLTSDLKGYIAHADYYLESDNTEHRRAADLLMMVQGWRRYDWRVMTGNATFVKKQPIEDHLYLFGRLVQTKKKYPVDGVNLSATLFNEQGFSLKGEAITDKEGYYAFKLPDCEGEWTLFMNTKKADEAVPFRVTIDRNFSPTARNLSYFDTQLLQPDEPSIMLKEIDTPDSVVSITQGIHRMPTLTVKAKRRWTDNARASWESEKSGAYMASLRYDCDAASDQIADSGESMPDFYEWLKKKNPFFTGIREADTSVVPTNKIYSESMKYKNRPIVWVLNNTTLSLTGINGAMRILPDLPISYSIDEFPSTVEDAISVYVTEDVKRAYSYYPSSYLLGRNPVTVFVYTHHTFNYKVKGLRRSHFQGYNKPLTFEMNDYSQMPPEADFRRTIYWNPNVTTDKTGKAKVEYYNNSTCRQMVISAEGISSDGIPMVF